MLVKLDELNDSPVQTVSLLEAESDIKQFVTFIVGDDVFAVDMSPVQEIIRAPDVVRVPLSPVALNGLANLRGRVLPIISLRSIFGFPDYEYDDATRAIVIDLGQPLGFIVDKVTSVIGVEHSKIEAVDRIKSTINTALLEGILKDVDGHAMIMVLDFEKLIATEFSEIAKMSQNALFENPKKKVLDEEQSDELQLVSFQVAGQEYALPIEDVQEIVQMPNTIVHVPNMEKHVLGVMTLRSRLLPLVSLRCLFSLPPQDAIEQSRIVVISLKDSSVGLVMDSVNEVLRVSNSAVDAVPNILSKDTSLSDISNICRLNNGKRLVSVISSENMFRSSAVKEVLSTMDALKVAEDDDSNDQFEVEQEDEQFVVFRLEKEEFGVPIHSVQEIVRIPNELTQIPKAPSFVEGVINLRGTVLPVIDQRRRLGINVIERNDRQRIMVFLFGAVRMGFIVDSVSEVLRIPKQAIEPAPKLSGEQAKLINRIANIENSKRLILLIDATKLVEDEDINELSRIEG